MRPPIYLADAFTEEAYRGNPAGVVPLEAPADAAWMQRVAMEMNQAETAFLSPREDGYDLRWFTPNLEIELCGHATLASAHILWSTGREPESGVLHFHTLSGVLTAQKVGDEIEMDFPAIPAKPISLPTGLEGALGAPVTWCGDNGPNLLCELADAAAVLYLKPDIDALKPFARIGVIVTAKSHGPTDFVSRYFAPNAGVPEDPVTGSAHCALAPYWAEKLGRSELTGFQASPRGGTVTVVHEGERVKLRGKATTTLVGELVC